MTVTLADVADACNLSTSTVSRALSDPGKVNAATRSRVERVAREMGYVPNRVARSLVSGRTDTIGLVVPDIANPFFPPVIKAVQSRARDKGYSVLLADTDEHAADEIDRARSLGKQADGLILASPRTSVEGLRRLAEGAPVVFANREVEGAPSVVIDEAEGMSQAVEHLVRLGHRRICYLSGPRRSWSNKQRHDAVVAASKEFGADLLELGPFEPQIQAGMRAADVLQSAGATAAIAYDDLIALGVMARLSEQGMLVGREVSVIGIDDSPMSQAAYPMLTSIHVPGVELGTTAVDLLLAQLQDDEGPESDEAPGTLRLETRLVIRGSTGLPVG
ncbi:MAG: LacI family transcriptional regulator [Actinomycetia bacterium]|nr:LacI family transcriptional regulator [Actinomycetes bacterium]